MATPGPATSSELNYPQDVAVDSAGNVYIADLGIGGLIDKVTPSGTLSIVAGTTAVGTGLPTPGPATSSRLNTRDGVAVDAQGNIYIADTGNSLVEKVTPSGQLSVIAGVPGEWAGTPTPGPATSSQLDLPIGIAVDPNGTVYIDDSGNNEIDDVTSSGTLGIMTGSLAGPPSAPPPPPTPPSIDAQASAKAKQAATAKLTTTTAGDLLVAFVSADSPAATGNTVTVSGGGLTWTRAGQENAALGDAELWTARATGTLSNTPITATAVGYPGYDVALTAIAFANATGIGASGEFSSADGAPTGTITTTQPNSWVFAAGDDWSRSVTRTPGSGQTVQHQATDSVGDTYWVQSTSAPTASPGPVTINDTAPGNDPFNLVLVEIL